MTVRVVTDSSADLPEEIVHDLGITVVPLLVRLGDRVFEDGISISKDEFYRGIAIASTGFPKTAPPLSGRFTEAYEKLADETTEIISIHISSKLSATCDCARIESSDIQDRCRVGVVDSLTTSIGLGLLVMQAAVMASDGANLEDILRATQHSVARTQFFGVVDTLEYLRRSGRLGRAAELLGSILNFKPILALRDGVANPIDRVFGRDQAIDYLCQMINRMGPITHLGVTYTSDASEVTELVFRLSQFFPEGDIVRTQCGAATGAHLGPDVLAVGVIQALGNENERDILTTAEGVTLQS